MDLMTKEIQAALIAAGLARTESLDNPVVVKFFTPDAQCTWWITEGELDEDQDIRLFGLCDLGMGSPELGYVMLSDLAGVRGKLGLPIERDVSYSGSLREAMKSAGVTWL